MDNLLSASRIQYVTRIDWCNCLHIVSLPFKCFDISFLPYSTLFNWLTGRVSDNFFCKSMKFIYRMKERECVIAAVVLL